MLGLTVEHTKTKLLTREAVATAELVGAALDVVVGVALVLVVVGVELVLWLVLVGLVLVVWLVLVVAGGVYAGVELVVCFLLVVVSAGGVYAGVVLVVCFFEVVVGSAFFVVVVLVSLPLSSPEDEPSLKYQVA